MHLTRKTRLALVWWISKPVVETGKSVFLMTWRVFIMDAFLGGVVDAVSVQGTWLSEGAWHQISILDLGAFLWSFQCWISLLQGNPDRIKAVNASAPDVEQQNFSKEKRTWFWLGHHFISNPDCVAILGMENWYTNFLSCRCLDSEECSVYPEVYQTLCCRWDTKREPSKFQVQRQTGQVHLQNQGSLGLIFCWNQFNLIYTFPPLNLITCLLHRIEEDFLVIFIPPNWIRKMWYVNIPILLAGSLWVLPGSPDILSTICFQ